MALMLGELAAVIKTDDAPMEQGLDKAHGKFKAFGDRLGGMATAAGAAAALALGIAIAGALELDKAQAKFEAQLGDTQYAEDMGRIAGKVYARGFGESAGAIRDTLSAILSSGLLEEDASDEQIEAITVKAQALADVFDQDVTAAARAAGQMMRNGLAADADEALDIITRGFQQTGDLAGDLLDTFSEYSTKFRDLGLSGAEALGLMTQAVKAGARDTDTAADALKEFAIRAVDGSKASAEGYDALGLSAKGMTAQIGQGGEGARKGLDVVLDRLRAMKDPVAQDAAAVALFGTKAEDLGDSLLAMDVDKATGALGEVEGAAAKMADTMEQSASQKLESFKRKAQEALVQKLGEAVPTLEKVAGWIERNSGFVGGLVTGLTGLVLVIGTILGIYKAWIILQTALNIVMMLNPLGLIILIIVGLIAVFAGLWMKFEGFRNFWKATWDVIWGAIKFVWDWISENWQLLLAIITGPIGLAVLAITKNWDKIKEGASAVWKWITDKFDALVGFFSGVGKRISKSVSGMWDGLKNSFRSALNWMIGKWNGFSLTIGGGSIMGVDIPSVRLNTPDIPYLASGGNVSQAGMAYIAERGREAVYLPAGASVQPLGPGQSAGSGGGLRELLLRGEFVARGSDLVLVLRERVAINGGNVQAVIGSNE